VRDKPPLSILTPWYERDELKLTLAANASVFRAHDAEILILNCGGSSERLRGLSTASEVSGIRQLDITVPRFNKSLALNVGLAHARADTVFILDADIVLSGPLPVAALDEQSFITIESVYESAPFDAKQSGNDPAVPSAKSAFLELTFRGGVKFRHQLSVRDAFGNVRGGPGLLLTKREDLLKIHGYNSGLDSWGWEDDDVLVRLQYALGRRRVQSGSALHLTHGDNRRFLRGSRDQSDQRNFIKCCRNYNNGIFLGSYPSDIAKLSDQVTETLVDRIGPTKP
jgi:glycosyltransferase involved in cell wall biosynthesis